MKFVLEYLPAFVIFLIALAALAISISALVIALKKKNAIIIPDARNGGQFNILNKMLKRCETEKKGEIVFAGDSITDFYKLDKWFPEYTVCNRGICGETTRNLLERFDETITVMKPKLIILLIGINDLNRGKGSESAIMGTESIIININKKLPQCKIILQSVYPVNKNKTDKFDGYNESANSSEIIAMNYKLRELSQKYNCRFADIYSDLIDENGDFKKDLTIDGLHPNENGYEIITKKLKPIINEML
ncbi:MAG: GDSL-type esterase/lipase family protein [Oscillospiraceae bacterium]